MRAFSFFRRLLFFWPVGFLLAGCLDPYTPDDINSPPTYLVVDGFINTRGISTIKLSYTYPIAAASAPPTEGRATVYIEQQDGPRYALQETPAGTYRSAALTLSTASKYRLRILTAGGKDYASDFVTAKTTPPIDSVTWKAQGEGVTISVNSHDDTRATQYYRWQYDETWEIRPELYPRFEFSNNSVRLISRPYPLVCWGTANSTTIRISKTTSLNQDRVSYYPLQSYPSTSSRLRHKYSILVSQYAQTREEYDYWDLLRKNTESIGTLFDPLPAQLTGNVHSLTNPAEIVLGYVGAYSVEEKRIFISRAQLPRSWPYISGYESCLPPDTVEQRDIQAAFTGGARLPVDILFAGGLLRGYTSSNVDCVDCRRRGTAVRPSFWQ